MTAPSGGATTPIVLGYACARPTSTEDAPTAMVRLIPFQRPEDPDAVSMFCPVEPANV